MGSSRDLHGTVVAIAGREVQIYARELFKAKLSSRAMKVLPGDSVRFESAGEEPRVLEIEERRNILNRTFAYRDREIAANLDLLLVVTAGGVLFNTIAIDRVCTVAGAAGIPVAIVVNKLDLGPEDATAVYRALEYPVLEISAKHGENFASLLELLEPSGLSVTALCGVSGVGKSTILNRLIPEADRKTGEVSARTGQGRQTTSQARGYLYRRSGEPLVLIDLPGSQAIGVSHFSRQEIRATFPEFSRVAMQCEYTDCLHLAEPSCGVKDAVEAGTIAISRYRSYLNMCQELDDMPDFRKYGTRRS